MTISLIAALAENRVIGKDNDLAWHLPDDMQYFMSTTKGHPVIMGRKNYDSIPEKFRPLKGRKNIIITRNKDYHLTHCAECAITHSIDEAFDVARQEQVEEVFVIGGGEIYKLALPMADKLYLTEIKSTIEGDTYFPIFDTTQWQEISRKPHDIDDRHEHAFDFVIYQRRS